MNTRRPQFLISLISVLLLSVFMHPAGAIDPSETLADPLQQEMYLRITKEVRCLVCQNQAISDSTAPLAADLRREIRRMIEAGETESEIKDFLVDRYGDFVLYKPRFKSWNLLLWFGPLVFLVIGAITLRRIAARRSTLPIDKDAP